jgi:hypothetical protein
MAHRLEAEEVGMGPRRIDNCRAKQRLGGDDKAQPPLLDLDEAGLPPNIFAG